MIMQIDVSEEILNLIDQKKRPVSMSEVNSYLGNSEEMARQSISSLLTEGRVHLIKNGKDVYLCNC